MLFYVDKEHPKETCFMERVLMRHSSEDGLYHLELVELADDRRTLGFEVNNTDKGGSRGLTSITAGFNSFVEAREYFLTCTKLKRLPDHHEVKGAVDIEKRNTPDARSVFLSNLDAEITQAYSSLTELLNIRRDATSSY
ncbi:TPA: hypothetical protein MIU95_26170 [Klebsiella pneumoniae]|uniref:hypothetical protein n=1 Tax=Klebsiella pneumoniae TaxID=573 RepID=UPI000BB6649E|nr:hypothetical protein [Klebsiella pneumoniae]MCD9957724.1 hypothetical protein [Klebsiella pneumoniae]PBP11611.1 hypothetical protein CI705_16630 [Klebsiella pneumoniae subsp. pneumoniae]PXJ16892.1 hypothetical protein DMR32_10815 [Klebsiella pneumoniae]HBR7556688.1 hypothetical protein [Klebsiella pneumoniae]HBV5765186.1 hypothetical protein [Klebsiella pneumoniae]